MGLVAPQYVGSSQTRDRTLVPCTGRRILNHCATREVPLYAFLKQDQTMMKRRKIDVVESPQSLVMLFLCPLVLFITPNVYFKYSFQTAAYFLFVQTSNRAEKNSWFVLIFLFVFRRWDNTLKCIDCEGRIGVRT